LRNQIETLLPPDLPAGADIVDEGRALATDWGLGNSLFLSHHRCACEADYKRRMAGQRRIMQHAQIGFRGLAKTRRAWVEIYERCEARGVQVDRYGICLDWTMGLPRELRDETWRGTGLVLEKIEDFVALTAGAPVAPHFGDFVLGFPAALENTQAALAAGSTAIGNLGQYFTFRLPGFDDDRVATEATLKALGLIAAQETEILIHSNLDDGFAAMFSDLSSSLGAVLIEKYIIEDLIGATVSHCYGHHFSDPARRLAFHYAIASISSTPGTMIYGNTTSYRGGVAENYAALARYLTADIAGQTASPSGHAVNPVPVSENKRIPDMDEIIDAQLFAGRLIELSKGTDGLTDMDGIRVEAARIVEGGLTFRDNVLAGFADAGIDTGDPYQMLLALRRLGGRRLETMFGAGAPDKASPGGRRPIVQASLIDETNAMARSHLARVSAADKLLLAGGGLRALVATTDVHEHGKMLLETVFRDLGVAALDGGISADPQVLAGRAAEARPDVLAVSTYNGIALTYISVLNAALRAKGLDIPVLIGGRLNQVPAGSNTSLPVDVARELGESGAIVCRDVEDAVPALIEILKNRKI
jgi:methylmalonyl-CoA mutase cobalamin-binding subunit